MRRLTIRREHLFYTDIVVFSEDKTAINKIQRTIEIQVANVLSRDFLTLTLLHKKCKRRDKSNLKVDFQMLASYIQCTFNVLTYEPGLIGAVQPTLNTVKVANWLLILLPNIFIQLFLFILHTETRI